MTERVEQILQEVLALPPADRARIAEKLLSSLDSPDQQRLDELCAREAEHRLDALDHGEMGTVPADRVYELIGLKTK